MNKQSSIQMNGYTMSASFHEIYTGSNKYALSSWDMDDAIPEEMLRPMFVELCKNAGLVQNPVMTFDPV